MGITPIMDWIRRHYARDYAPNTRETIRRQTMHQLVAAGIALYNPDKPDRPVNSPKAVYQIEPNVLLLLKSYGTRTWPQRLKQYLENNATLTKQYAQARLQTMIPVKIAPDTSIALSPGSHNELVRRIIEDFAPRFAPGGTVVYVGDTEDKWAYFDNTLLASLGVEVDAHGKMPDVILFCSARNWLFLIESVTSHGPVDSKRHEELAALFASAQAGLVYVTAFPDRTLLGRHLPDISWETEVWVADAPSHIIHFDGERFLGPYA